MSAEPLDEAVWDALARNLVRAELMKRGLSYARLVEALAAIGVQETEQSIKSKMSRGRFPFAFFLQTMVAIGGQWLEVPTVDELRRGEGGQREWRAVACPIEAECAWV